MPSCCPASAALPPLPDGNLLAPLKLNTEKWLREVEHCKRVRARDPDGSADKRRTGGLSIRSCSGNGQPPGSSNNTHRGLPIGKATSVTAASPSLQRVLTKLMAFGCDQREDMGLKARCNSSTESQSIVGAASVGAVGQGGQLLPTPSPVPPLSQGAWVCACDFTELGSPPPQGVALGMLAHRKTAQFLQRRRYEGTKALAPGKRQDPARCTVSAPLLLVSSGTCGRTSPGTTSRNQRTPCTHPSRRTETLHGDRIPKRHDAWRRPRTLHCASDTHSDCGMQPPTQLSLQDADISARLLRSRGLINASRLVHSLSEVGN